MQIIKVSNYNARVIALLTNDNYSPVKFNDNVVNCGSFNAMRKYMKFNGYTNPRDYELAVQFLNSNKKLERIKFSDLQEIGDKQYQGYSRETNELIQFNFETTEKVTSLRYLVFDHGDEIRLEINKASNDKSKYLMTIVRQAISKMLKSGKYIDKYCINKYDKHTRIDLKDCQESIYICHNYQLIHKNHQRKDLDMKCLPFDKRMDKFLTIYIYTTTEYIPGIVYGEKYKEFLDVLMDNVNQIYKSKEENNPKYEEVDFFTNLYI